MNYSKFKKLVLTRDGGLCVLGLRGCTHVAVDVDHRAGRGMGGAKALDSPENGIAACRPCNDAKEHADVFERGRLLYRGIRVERAIVSELTLDRARNTAVRYPDGSWWLLDPDGSRRQLSEVVALETNSVYVPHWHEALYRWAGFAPREEAMNGS